MVKRRLQGDRLEKDKTKRTIITLFTNNYPKKLPTSEIVEYLRSEFNLRNNRNVQDHLNYLQKQFIINTIKHKQQGRESKWFLQDKFDSFKNISYLMSKIQDAQCCNYLSSNYYRDMIKKYFDSIINDFFKTLNIDIKAENKEQIKKVFHLLNIGFQISPQLLNLFLFPNSENNKEYLGKTRLDYLVIKLIFMDLNEKTQINLPPATAILTRLTLNIEDYKSDKSISFELPEAFASIKTKIPPVNIGDKVEEENIEDEYKDMISNLYKWKHRSIDGTIKVYQEFIAKKDLKNVFKEWLEKEQLKKL